MEGHRQLRTRGLWHQGQDSLCWQGLKTSMLAGSSWTLALGLVPTQSKRKLRGEGHPDLSGDLMFGKR